MPNRIATIASLAALALVSFFGGLVLGRHDSVHHYEKFGTSNLLLDTSTGVLCDPLVKPADQTSSNAVDDVFTKLQQQAVPPCKR